jgi:hypothetical protein
MRNDMLKVITEPARRGVRYYSTLRNEYRAAKNFVLDDDLEVDDIWCGRILPMRAKTVGYDGKEANYTVNPLLRFLHSQLGKNWDDIYSQISSIKSDLGRRYDIKRMIGWNVETNTFIEDGEIYYSCKYHGPRLINNTADQLYVHPITNVLCISTGLSYKTIWRNRQKEKKTETAKTHKIVSKDLQFHKIDGNWYRVKVQPFDWTKDVSNYDVFGSILTQRWYNKWDLARACMEKYGAHVTAVEKQAASKKDIRRYKLS